MLAHIFGALGIGTNIIIYQQKEGRKLVFFKLVSDFLWAIHYYFLGANAASMIAVIGIFRETVFLKQNKTSKQSHIWLAFFLILSIISTIITWKNIFSLLPLAASVLSVISFWKKNPDLSRCLAFPVSIFMFTYDVFCHSLIGIVNEILTIVSCVAGIIKNNK